MQEVRRYRGSDARLIERAGVLHLHLTADLADFAAFSSRFDAAYLNAFKASIDAASKYTSDNAVVAIGMGNTGTVERAMAQARLLYRRAKNYAEQAYGVGHPQLLAFTRGYAAARQQQDRMLIFLDTLLAAVAAHQPALQDPQKGGMPATFVAELEAARQALLLSNRKQESQKGARKATTAERIALHNAVFGMMQQICRAAKQIYEDGSAHQRSYRYK